MVNIFQVLIVFVAVCHSNKFDPFELLSLKNVEKSEYMATNKFSKLNHKFSSPRVIRVKNKLTDEIFEKIRGAKFGVVIHYDPMSHGENDDDDDEENDIEEDDKENVSYSIEEFLENLKKLSGEKKRRKKESYRELKMEETYNFEDE